MTLSKREVKRRIKKYLAHEIRQRIACESPEYLLGEPNEVYVAWRDTIWDIADKISPEQS